MSTIPAAKLPPVSTAPVANLLTVQLLLLIQVVNLPPVSNDTGGKYWEQYQAADTLH
jgi:hypothetical protein